MRAGAFNEKCASLQCINPKTSQSVVRQCEAVSVRQYRLFQLMENVSGMALVSMDDCCCCYYYTCTVLDCIYFNYRIILVFSQTLVITCLHTVISYMVNGPQR